MTSTRSSKGRTSSNELMGVAGFNETPALTPSSFIASTKRGRWVAASTWTGIISAPALVSSATCSPRRLKSAERIDGASLIRLLLMPLPNKLSSPRQGSCHLLGSSAANNITSRDRTFYGNHIHIVGKKRRKATIFVQTQLLKAFSFTDGISHQLAHNIM